MTYFLGLVKYVGIGVVVLMAVVVAIAAIVEIFISFSPSFIPGLFQSR